MKKIYIGVVAAMCCYSLSACETTSHSNSLDEKILSERRADTPDEIAQRAAETFANAPGLTREQKEGLNKLYLKTYAESRAIRKEIGQMKSLLFKEAANKKIASPEFNELTRRILDADQRRLNLMFAALMEMQNIVGFGPDKKELYEHLRDYEVPGTPVR